MNSCRCLRINEIISFSILVFITRIFPDHNPRWSILFFHFYMQTFWIKNKIKNNKTRVRNTCFYINNFNNVSLTFQNNNNFKHIISFLIFLSFNLTPQSWTWIYSFWKWSYQWSFSFSWSQNLWWICLSIVSLIISTNWYTI